MSWLCRDPEILEEDLDTLTFEPRESLVFVIEREDNAPDITETLLLNTQSGWQAWFNQQPLEKARDNSSRINLIVGDRAERPWGHDPSLVSKLPWSKDVFYRIKNKLLVHSCIVRTINRSTSCMFSRMEFDWNLGQSRKRSLVYNCRSAASWPQDMALSVTFLPDSLTTNAILVGCDMKTPDKYDEDMTIPDIIMSRLTNSDTSVFHPMLLPAIFADIERDRQIELVREKLQQLGQRVQLLATNYSEPKNSTTQTISNSGRNSHHFSEQKPQVVSKPVQILRRVFDRRVTKVSLSEPKSIQTGNEDQQSTPLSPTTSQEDKPAAKLWLEISCLRNGLENWQRQLYKMIDHVEELGATEFAWGKHSNNEGIRNNIRTQQLRDAGTRIKERLQEIVDEYNENIRECTHIMGGMNLAAQLELSHIGRADAKTNLDISRVNLGVARMTRQDGSLMKSIAMLGMFFLPATFVTAFFSMGFFDWESEGLSGYFWIYVVTVVALTLLTVGIFYVCVLRRRNNGCSKGGHADYSVA